MGEIDELGGIFRPDVLKTIKHAADSFSSELRELSLAIHDHPEIAYQEKFAHDTLTGFMSNHGFTVTKHYLNLETAWRAEFQHKKGGRVIGVNSEMDALPGIGHACGHNLIAIAGVGVALSLKAALVEHDIPGKIVLLGTPAEEGGNGKGVLIERGGYDDMDICVMCHPGGGPLNSTGVGTTLAIQRVNVQFFGHTAHAAAAPWEGQNALDAAYLAYSSISMLRQQIKPNHRVHGVVHGKDWAPNIIPDYASMRWYIRAPSWDEVVSLRERVYNCFEAAAKATGCRIELESDNDSKELRQNSVLAEEYLAIASEGVGLNLAHGGSSASTDFGNVTYVLPALHPGFSIPTEPNGGNHTPAFTAAARTQEAHVQTLSVIKALAHTSIRILLDEEFYKKVKGAFVPGVVDRSRGESKVCF